MSEGGGGSRVGQVVGRYVDGLHGRDGPLLGGGDALLQGAHLGGQGGLITHGAGHAAQQRRYLAARLGEAEDVVDEEKHVLVLTVAEVFRHRKSGQRHAHTGSRRLVHLAVDQRGFVDDAALLHLVVQVVALTGALAHAGKHGQAAVLLGHVVDQLHDQHRLAHARAAEQADLAALGIGGDQVHHLDAGFQDLGGGFLLLKAGGLTVNGPAFHAFGRGLFVDGLTQQVKDAAQALIAYGHGDGAAGVYGVHTAHHAVGGVHGDAAGNVVANVLRHLGHDLAVAALDLNGGKQFGQLAVLEADVQHRADDLNHLADVFRAHDGKTPFLTRQCSAPATISVISWVMAP